MDGQSQVVAQALETIFRPDRLDFTENFCKAKSLQAGILLVEFSKLNSLELG